MRFDIYMSCPVCLLEGYNSERVYWRHSWPCNGQLTLDDKAEIQCDKCKRSEHLTKMKLKCGNNRHNFIIPSAAGFASAISTSAQLVEKAGLAWLQSALNNL